MQNGAGDMAKQGSAADRVDYGPLTPLGINFFVRPFKKSGNDSAVVWTVSQYVDELATLQQAGIDNLHNFQDTDPNVLFA